MGSKQNEVRLWGFLMPSNMSATILWRTLVMGVAITMLIGTTQAFAQIRPFESGWTLTPDASSISFESLKNVTEREISSFAEISGQIDRSGKTTMVVVLDSVDTQIDLRDVRMRFLFFETFNFPIAKIDLQLTASLLRGLTPQTPIDLTLPLTLELKGVQNEIIADVRVTLTNEDRVTIETSRPISIPLSDFDLMEGHRKLEEAAEVVIRPSADINASLTFERNLPRSNVTTIAATEQEPVVSATNEPSEPQAAADLDACIGRFKVLSKTRSIYFEFGSAILDPTSAPLLRQVRRAIEQCPDLSLSVEGHTDNIGSAAQNQALSEARAQSIVNFLQQDSDFGGRISAKGIGEARPLQSNLTAAGRQFNRRIEFKALPLAPE